MQKLSIIPRTGGALGFTYIPPNTEDRALMFDSEIRGQLAMLMGGRAAEQLTCASVSTGKFASALLSHPVCFVVVYVHQKFMGFCCQLLDVIAMQMLFQRKSSDVLGQVDLLCAAGAVDDIRRATDIALRSVSEFGLSAAVGPLNVGVLAAGGSDDGAWLMRDNGTMAQLVEAEVGGCGRITLSLSARLQQTVGLCYFVLLCPFPGVWQGTLSER